jgi:hypothetical protein
LAVRTIPSAVSARSSSGQASRAAPGARRIRLPRRRFRGRSRIPPRSPPTVNGTTPATPVNSSATTSPSRRYCAPTEGPPARPDRWGKAPRRSRLGLTSFGRSTAVPTGPGQRPSLPVRQLGPRDGREGFVPIVAENFAQGGTKAICIDRESLLQLGRYNSYITIAEAAVYLQIGGHTHVSAHGAATMPVLIHQMNQQAPMSGW